MIMMMVVVVVMMMMMVMMMVVMMMMMVVVVMTMTMTMTMVMMTMTMTMTYSCSSDGLLPDCRRGGIQRSTSDAVRDNASRSELDRGTELGAGLHQCRRLPASCHQHPRTRQQHLHRYHSALLDVPLSHARRCRGTARHHLRHRTV